MQNKQTQVVIIHGGNYVGSDEAFVNDLKSLEVKKEFFYPKIDWKANLPQELGEHFEVLAPKMPNKQNAKYEHWKIWFEKMNPFLQDDCILIGHSLGGTFLVKYLSENKFSKKIKALILVAAANSDVEGLGGFACVAPIDNVQNACQNIYILHSKDDPVVPASDAEFFKNHWPKANIKLFEDKKHFNAEQFPEIIALIKNITGMDFYEDLSKDSDEFSFILKSAKHGIGVFATRDIKKNSYLRLFGNEKLHEHKVRVLKTASVPEIFQDYCINRSDEELICPQDFGHMPVGWYLNHSSKPNAIHKDYNWYALQDIKAGEEILIDYNSLEEPEDNKEGYYSTGR